jgi:hypothetical protein
LFPFVRQSAISFAARVISASRVFNDRNVSIDPLIAWSRIEEESGIGMDVYDKKWCAIEGSNL